MCSKADLAANSWPVDRDVLLMHGVEDTGLDACELCSSSVLRDL